MTLNISNRPALQVVHYCCFCITGLLYGLVTWIKISIISATINNQYLGYIYIYIKDQGNINTAECKELEGRTGCKQAISLARSCEPLYFTK